MAFTAAHNTYAKVTWWMTRGGLGRVALLVALGPMVAANAWATAKWEFAPQVQIGEIYSDNINLAPDGEEDGDFITEIRPSFRLSGQSRRLELDFIYGGQALYFVDDEAVELNHQLQAEVTGELWSEHFFVDVSGSVRQENITNQGQVADSNISRTGNQTDVFTYSISPYFRYRLSNVAEGELRYGYGVVENEDRATGGEIQTYSASMDSDYFSRASLSLRYRRTDESGEDGTDILFQEVTSGAQLRFNRRLAMSLGAGYEKNDFDSPRSDIDGVTWRAAVAWTPTRRSRFEAGVRHRFFGLSPFASARYVRRRTAVSASYAITNATTTQLQLQRRTFVVVDAFGEPIVDPTNGRDVELAVDIPTQVSEVLIRRRGEASVAWVGRRTSINLSGFHERREFESTDTDERVFGFGLGATRRFTRRASATVDGGWQRSDFITGVQADRWDVGGRYSYRLSDSIRTDFEVRRVIQDSELDTDSYDENRVSLFLNKQF